jgi:hypothetical protein
MPERHNGEEPLKSEHGYQNPELARLSGEIAVLFKEYFRIMIEFYKEAVEFNSRLKKVKAFDTFTKKSIQLEWGKKVESMLQNLYSIFNAAEEKLKEIKRLPGTKEVTDKVYVLEFTLALANLNWDSLRRDLMDLDKAEKELEKYKDYKI